VAIRWSARNEELALQMPQQNAWDVLQLLAEESPAALLEPFILANLLR